MPLEPKEAHDNYHYVYEAQVGQDRNEVNVELLICLEILDVDSVQARLCGRTGTKEPSVDGGHVSVRVQNRQGYQAHQGDVRI